MKQYKLSDMARVFAIRVTEKSGKEYSGFNYALHLYLVNTYIEKYLHLFVNLRGFDFDSRETEEVCATGWLHDVLEDVKEVKYRDIERLAGVSVAESCYSLTTGKARNRKERHSFDYYNLIALNTKARFVKIADRLANTKFSKWAGDNGYEDYRMFKLYKQEYVKFKEYLYQDAYKEMFDELEFLYSDSSNLSDKESQVGADNNLFKGFDGLRNSGKLNDIIEDYLTFFHFGR